MTCSSLIYLIAALQLSSNAVRPHKGLLLLAVVLDLCPQSLIPLYSNCTRILLGNQQTTVSNLIGNPQILAALQACILNLLTGMAAIGRDLKAENVLLHEDDAWVLCDYGSVSTWAGIHETSNQIMIAEDEIRRHTTAAYRAPEASHQPTGNASWESSVPTMRMPIFKGLFSKKVMTMQAVMR